MNFTINPANKPPFRGVGGVKEEWIGGKNIGGLGGKNKGWMKIIFNIINQ
jgi:hypothetical protein